MHEPGRARKSCPPRSGPVNALPRLSVLSHTIPHVLLHVSGYEYVRECALPHRGTPDAAGHGVPRCGRVHQIARPKALMHKALMPKALMKPVDLNCRGEFP